jgi:hypothetical protein
MVIKLSTFLFKYILINKTAYVVMLDMKKKKKWADVAKECEKRAEESRRKGVRSIRSLALLMYVETLPDGERVKVRSRMKKNAKGRGRRSRASRQYLPYCNPHDHSSEQPLKWIPAHKVKMGSIVSPCQLPIPG